MNFSYESILPIAPLKIAALEGCRELAETMDKYLVEFRQKSNQEFQDQPNFHGYHEDTYLIKTACPRFGTGEAKGIIYESIRGADLFILADVPTIVSPIRSQVRKITCHRTTTIRI